MDTTGLAARMMGTACARGITKRAIGWVKWRAGNTIQPGQWLPKTNPRGANGDQQTNPG